MAWCRMLAVSLSSTKKVLSPREKKNGEYKFSLKCCSYVILQELMMLPAIMRSEAPSRVKTLSVGVKRRLSAGT